MMPTDIFRPHSEPARTIYDAFQAEAEKRHVRTAEQWRKAELETVWRVARDHAQQYGLRVLTLDEVERAEQYAMGSVDYGATWAYRVCRAMTLASKPAVA